MRTCCSARPPTGAPPGPPSSDVTRTGDRGYYSAPAISPNGTEAWIVYNAFLEPFKTSAEGPANDRPMVGVVLHADVAGGGVGTFSEIHRGASGDARGSSQNNLAAEFLGDYVYAAATRTYGTAVWNDVRRAADCPAIDEYRQELHEEAVALGVRTADAEEPRGAESREQRGKKAPEERSGSAAPSSRTARPPSATRTSSGGHTRTPDRLCGWARVP